MQYLIWSNEHAAWWRSGHLGYTEIISKAGRYSREEAEQICADANRYRPEGAQPHEVAVLAPESVDALEAENQRLREALSDYYHQHRCGCGHPACKRCRDDKYAEEALAAGGAG